MTIDYEARLAQEKQRLEELLERIEASPDRKYLYEIHRLDIELFERNIFEYERRIEQINNGN